MKQNEMKTITREDPSYPSRMKELSSMPETLYYLGELPDPDKPTAAIVGARLCSHYGRVTAYEFGRILASKGVQIISGMAAGIDSSAQEGALDAGGTSFAVLGSGADVCYPKENTTLYNRLKKQGGILSELPPGTKPLPRHFPSRNRIISALADVVVVVEARSRSGSLITVDFALSQGKTVFAVPGRVGDSLSDGCNALIYQGAGIAFSPEAILFELKLITDFAGFALSRQLRARLRHCTMTNVAKSKTLSPEAIKVYRCLSFTDPLRPDDITVLAELPASLVLSSLSELIRAELVSEAGWGAYMRSSPDLAAGKASLIP